MADSNVTIVGNLVEDPELRFTSGGQGMAKLRVACNRRWQDRASGEWREETSFFGVTCWRELAENVANSLHKGARVVVSGRLQQRSWETPDGDKRSVVEIQADEVGPSLRWATAEVTRVRREGGGEFAPASAAAPAAAAPASEPAWEDEPAF